MRSLITLVLNIVWLLTAGWSLFLAYVVAGLLACLLVVTIPFGLASFRIAGFVIWPFGREVVDTGRAGAASAIGNVIWFLVAGWWLALGHILTGIAQCVTIIGIPFGIANFKLVPAAFWPLGREIVDLGEAGGHAPV